MGGVAEFEGVSFGCSEGLKQKKGMMKLSGT